MNDKIKKAFSASDVFYMRGDGSKSNQFEYSAIIGGSSYKIIIDGAYAIKINYNGIENERVIL